MSEGNKLNLQARNRELVSRIYEGALNPSQYNSVFKAWDQHFQEILESEGNQSQNISPEFDWADEFVGHFEKAGEMFDQLLPRQLQSPDVLVSSLPYPAFTIDNSGRFISANPYCNHVFKNELPARVFDLALDIDSSNRIAKMLAALNRSGRPETITPTLIRFYTEQSHEPQIMVCETLESPKEGQKGETAVLLFKSILAVWNQDVEQALTNAFDLTPAELDLIGNLYKGLTIKEISEWKQRSQATLRTQLSSILNKTGTKSQNSLARMVVSLVHMISHKNNENFQDRSALLNGEYPDIKKATVELSNGLIQEYAEFGAANGRPFLFIQPTSKPAFTSEDIAHIKKQNLRIIIPVQPGNGRTSKFPLFLSSIDRAELYIEFLNRLNIEHFHCGGHTSGGIYALEISKKIPDRCKAVLLVDTGAPLKTPKQIFEMHVAPRRLFVAARFFPKATITPMKYMAADFYASEDGERRAIEYFYDGSPADQKIMREPKYWEQTRRNLAYSFHNVPQISVDVAIWARNNSGLFNAVVKNTPIRFFHGAKNLMMRAKYIQTFCNTHENATCRLTPEIAQLNMYAAHDDFVEEILDICKT